VQRVLRRLVRGLLLALAATLVPGGTLRAQAVAGQSLRLEMPSFVTASYGTAGASTIYAGYSFGPGAVAVGMVLNPRSGYRELVLGAVTRAVRGRQGLALALAVADAPESPCLRVPRPASAGCAVTARWALLPLGTGGSSTSAPPGHRSHWGSGGHRRGVHGRARTGTAPRLARGQ
jgi:hypothetical protein